MLVSRSRTDPKHHTAATTVYGTATNKGEKGLQILQYPLLSPAVLLGIQYSHTPTESAFQNSAQAPLLRTCAMRRPANSREAHLLACLARLSVLIVSITTKVPVSATTIISNSQMQSCVQDGTVRFPLSAADRQRNT